MTTEYEQGLSQVKIAGYPFSVRYVVLTGLLALALAAQAQESADDTTVFTFYGLLELEDDASVPDAEKIRQWEAFIRRSEQQTAYAREAVTRWRDATRIRLIQAALALEADEASEPQARMKAWEAVVAVCPAGDQRSKATKRVQFWRAKETKRRVEAAKRTEESRAPKLVRIRAWAAVAEWDGSGKAGQAARQRAKALQDQLYREAMNLEELVGIDAETKIAAWREVLDGAPSAEQVSEATRALAAHGVR